MRIIHLGPQRGGVAHAAKRIHLAQQHVGLDSTYLAPTHSQPATVGDQLAGKIQQKLGLIGLLNRSSLTWDFSDYDIIHLHGMASKNFNLHALKRYERHSALVWTMHDKHLGTALCGYPDAWDDCQRWRDQCGQCPVANIRHHWLDLSTVSHKRKRRAIQNTDLTVVAANQWMFDFISQSPLTRQQPLARIPHAIDTAAFVPVAPTGARQALGLPLDVPLVFAIASRWNNARKGLAYFAPLLAALKQQLPEVALVLVGREPAAEKLAPLQALVPVYTLGYLADKARLSQAYSASDMFVILSEIDNSPSVVLESQACGTPVAGFAVGGIPDMITPETGVLVPLGEVTQLAQAMGAWLKDKMRLQAAQKACRSHIEETYSFSVVGGQYRELYERCLAQS